MVNDCGLNNFLSCENAPSHGIHVLVINILELLSSLVDRLVCDRGKLAQVLDQSLNDVFMNEHFDVGLLVNISVVRAPAVLSVCRRGSVDTRLRVDCEHFVIVKFDQELIEVRGLGSDRPLGEWEFLALSGDEVYKSLGHRFKRSD